MLGTLARNLDAKESLMQGSMTFWDIYEAGGIPQVASYLFYPVSWLVMPFDAVTQTTLYFTLHLSLGGIFLFFYLKEIKASVHAAFFGGMVFMISNMLLSRMGHSGVAATMIWTPLLLLAAEKLLKHDAKLKYALLAGIVVAMQALAGFQQVLIYSCIFVAIYYIACGLYKKIKWYKLVGSLIVAAIVGVCLWAVILLPTLQLMHFTGRASGDSFDFFASYSFDPRVALGMVSPAAWSALDGISYRGEILNDVYFGIPVLGLCIYTLIFHRKNFRIKLLGVGMALAFLFMICPSLGPIGRVIQKIPIIGAFRCTSRAIFLFAICEIALAALAVDKIIRKKEYRNYCKFSLIFFFVIFVVCFILYINRNTLFTTEKEISLNVKLWMPALVACINLAIAFIAAAISSKDGVRYLAALFPILLICVNVGDVLVLNTSSVFNTLEMTQRRYDPALVQDTEFSQFMNQNAGLEYRVAKVKDVSLSSSVNMDVKNEVINKYMNLSGYVSYENKDYIALFNSFWDSRFPGTDSQITNLSLYSMLGVKYIAVQDGYDFEAWENITRGRKILDIENVAVPESEDVAVVWETELELKPDQFYIVEVQAERNEWPAVLQLDFYGGAEYDHSEHDMNINELAQEFIIHSGEDAPQKAMLRLIANAEETFTVERIQVYEAEGARQIELPLAASVEDYRLVDIAQGSKQKNGDIKIYENEKAKPLVYSADHIIGTQDAKEIIAHSKGLDFDQNIYVAGHSDMQLADSNTNITIEDIRYNSVKATVSSETDSFIVMAQNYYPAWKAYIDGKETPIYIANGTLQGVDVPEGTHTVEFRYVPDYYYIGAAISGGTVVFLVLYFIWNRRKEKRISPGRKQERSR
ncbi:YfhO family protein [Christensenella tenuis]